MVLNGIQTCFAPIMGLIVFILYVSTDPVQEKRIKYKFIQEAVALLIILTASIINANYSAPSTMDDIHDIHGYITAFIFTLSPIPPALLISIYRKDISPTSYFVFGTLFLSNAVFCFSSLRTEWVFSIDENNLFSIEPMLISPFAIASYYLLKVVYVSFTENINMPNKQDEAAMLTLTVALIGVTLFLEYIFDFRYLVWVTASVCLILYYLILNKQYILFDSLTGTYGKLAYQKKLNQLDGKKSCTIAIIDMNGLKKINDIQGHGAGDLALKQMSAALLYAKSKDMLLYRFGGDEFVMLGLKSGTIAMENTMLRALKTCGKVDNTKVSFAYGIVSYTPGDSISQVISEADKKMYRQKAMLKKESL